MNDNTAIAIGDLQIAIKPTKPTQKRDNFLKVMINISGLKLQFRRPCDAYKFC